MERDLLNRYLRRPQNFLYRILCSNPHLIKNDKLYLKMRYSLCTGKKLNLKNPQTFNEKLQWLKLYNRRPEYTTMVDKYAAKEYVAGIIGKEHVIPTLGVWNKPSEIDWNSLPKRFVLKTTHDSGGIIICKDKDKLDKDAAIKKLEYAITHDNYSITREWPYKNVPRRILAEEYMEDEDGQLKDYKVFCFDGIPRLVEVDYNRFQGHMRNLYTMEWERINATIGFPSDPEKEFAKPQVMDELKELCQKLSLGIPHVRTDFYIVENKIFFGELTFFHGSGMELISPEGLNKKMGDWIILPIVENSNRGGV